MTTGRMMSKLPASVINLAFHRNYTLFDPNSCETTLAARHLYWCYLNPDREKVSCLESWRTHVHEFEILAAQYLQVEVPAVSPGFCSSHSKIMEDFEGGKST